MAMTWLRIGKVTLNNKEQADPQLVHRDEVGEGHLVHPKKVLEEAAAGVEEVEDPPMGMKEERKREERRRERKKKQRRRKSSLTR